MEVEIQKKGPFKVIGLEESGSVKDANEWVPKLWTKLFDRLDEISHLIKTDRTSEAWGLMSGVEDYLEPWEEEGRYLAGFELKDDVEPPEGWTVWEIPEHKYAVVECKMDTYIEAYDHVVKEYLPENDYDLSGAVHEFYPEEFEDIDEDTFYLYIAIENK